MENIKDINENGDNILIDEENNLHIIRNDHFNDNLMGMTVENEDEAYSLYNEYAIRKGFSIRRHTHRFRAGTREILMRIFCCSKQGYSTADPNSTRYRSRMETRTGCEAMIRFSVKNGLLEVTKFIENHNHELALPSEVHLLRSNRDVTIDKGKVIDTMVNSGISTKNVYSYMSNEVGGSKFIGFTKRDCYNYVNKQKMVLIEAGDSQSLVNHFKLRQTEDAMFFYTIQVDQENRMTNFFWRDGGSMHDYDSFGDVVIFDTTYRTNRYNLICAPFVGVNHHWQNIMFGCAFLLDETTESFIWLFTSFLESMGGKAPKTIFTDEDQAMANAIKEVFPHTSHRLCLWHISKNASSHLGSFNSNKEFRKLFYECLMHCDSELEFENTWTKLMTQFEDLKDNSWLRRLYEKRKKWCTGLNKDCFSAEIKSSQRSESTNSVLNGLANKTTSLTNFVLAFEKLIAGWREGEASEDFRCKQGIPLIKIKNSSILRSAAGIYTIRMYKVFEDEFLNGIAKTWREVSSHENIYTFELIGEEGRGSKTRIVVFNAYTIDISCSCKKFESMCILCSDALRILSVKNVKMIPEKYILKRWTRSAKANVIKSIELEESSKHVIQETETIFWNHLMSRAYNLFCRSQRFETTRKICKDALTRIEMEVERELEKLNLEADQIDDRMNTDPYCDNNVAILNPPRVKPKGVGNARLKGHFEKRKIRAKKESRKLVKQKVTNTEDVLIQPVEISQRLVVPSQSFFGPVMSPQNISVATTLPFSMQTMSQNMQYNYNGIESNMSFTSMMQHINHRTNLNQERDRDPSS